GGWSVEGPSLAMAATRDGHTAYSSHPVNSPLVWGIVMNLLTSTRIRGGEVEAVAGLFVGRLGDQILTGSGPGPDPDNVLDFPS
ncbi:MAG: hypothetical protein KKB59_19215, partial [Spirochaetes bacterium]|nr:hypothetical protein [Spirochaetota bacterium]